MAWTQPKTWSNEPLVAGDLNTHLRDNLEALKDPPQGGIDIDNATNYTTTSTAFVDVDSDDFSTTITTHGGDVLVTFCVTMVHSASAFVHMDVEVDGNRYAGDDGYFRSVVSNQQREFSIQMWIKDLPAGEHTFVLQWKVSSGTMTLYGGQSGSSNDVHGQWDVREVS